VTDPADVVARELEQLKAQLEQERLARKEAESVAQTALHSMYEKQLSLQREVEEGQRLLAQFRQAQKMEAVGRLAGGVAHDFNNMLTVIIGTSDVVLEEYELDAEARALVSQIRKTGERAAVLTRQLLAFSRKQVLSPVVLNFNAVVTDIEPMLARMIGEDITISLVLEPAIRLVKADLGQIEQVLMNLVVNSRDAMPDGGRLLIETGNVVLDEGYAQVRPEVPPGPYAMLAVSDTGFGMTAEIKRHLFEPFFTTKELGKGTGLGLSTVYGIVKQSGGFIYVYSEVGQGTTFKLYFPQVNDQRPADVQRIEPAAMPGGGSETLLLVEDDEAVAKLARLILQSKGYTVVRAESGEEALGLWGARLDPVDLVLTDVILPGMNGRSLADRLRELDPSVKLLFMSGYTEDAIVHHGVLEPGIAFLAKPFTPNELARKVREVLDA
jgi:two-component system, cell cycle sensor histidine kinase and response regulator CckA